jgi:hypothetical protein
MADITPKDIVPEQTFGLPVRGKLSVDASGRIARSYERTSYPYTNILTVRFCLCFRELAASDKCHRESECLTFTQHMQALRAWWMKDHGSNGAAGVRQAVAVLFTSESDQMDLERLSYVNESIHNPHLHPPPTFRFVTNERDARPNTGNSRYIAHLASLRHVNMTADTVMLSAVSSIQFQLLAGSTMGNCCSNFHMLLKEMLEAGCGATDNSFYCMDRNEDPALRVCCGWSNTCKAIKQRDLDALRNQTLATATPR